MTTKSRSRVAAASSSRARMRTPSSLRLLREHLALAVHRGEHVTPVVWHTQLDHRGQRTEAVADRAQQPVDAFAVAAEMTTAPGAGLGELVGLGCDVDLVEGQQLGHVAGTDLAEHPAHGIDLLVGIQRRGVDDVDEQVGFGRHLERRLERLDELVGQLADEPDGVGEQHRLATGEVEAPGRGVERCEQPVLHQHTGIGEVVEQGRLAGVGVARRWRHGARRERRRRLRWLTRWRSIILQVGFELVDAALDAAAIDLELRLARTTAPDGCAGTTAGGAGTRLLRERSPAPPKPRQAVAQLGQLDLGLALLARGVLGEDVEDHRCAVDGGAARAASRGCTAAPE